MSKIYEALLRAELERIAAGEAPTPNFQEKATEAAAITERAELSAAGPLEVSPTASKQANVKTSGEDARERAASQVSTEPLEGIRAEKWEISQQMLPALLGRGGAAEQFRSLRSRLFEYRGFQQLKTVLVSSGLPQEGKSFVAANLAASLTRHRDTRVLLVDGDLRRYSLQRYLGAPTTPGLAEYLMGKASAMEVMQRAEITADSEGFGFSQLTFIAGGDGGDRVADLSGNPKFGELIDFAAPHFDWIIVDSSPVTLVADAVNLARSCDGVLLVVRGGVTKYEVAQRARAAFQSSTMLGVVVNAVEDAPAGDYYGYGPRGE